MKNLERQETNVRDCDKTRGSCRPAFYFNLLIFLVKNVLILKDLTLSMSLQHTITPCLFPRCLLTPAWSPPLSHCHPRTACWPCIFPALQWLPVSALCHSGCSQRFLVSLTHTDIMSTAQISQKEWTLLFSQVVVLSWYGFARGG